MSRRNATIALLIVGALAIVWLVFTNGPRWWRTRPVPAPAGAVPAATSAGERKIKATLYYVSEDGLSLVGVEREVPFGDPIVEQARRLVETQLAAAPAPLASAIPEGTTLRALFLSERGDAFVDLSPEVTTRHVGGALDELFTVYAIVDTLTVNLPAITRVQILINGKEADTLAGHVDIRRPLQKNLEWATPHVPEPPPETHGLNRP
jgi:spore germination protein GerM